MKAKKGAQKPEADANAWHPAARKLGEAFRFSFLRCIKQGVECTMPEAETIFQAAVDGGVIIQTGMAGIVPTVPKYRMK